MLTDKTAIIILSRRKHTSFLLPAGGLAPDEMRGVPFASLRPVPLGTAGAAIFGGTGSVFGDLRFEERCDAVAGCMSAVLCSRTGQPGQRKWPCEEKFVV